jgi:hypothetical protein
MGETSFPLKYSAICFVAASVTSTIIFLLFFVKISLFDPT